MLKLTLLEEAQGKFCCCHRLSNIVLSSQCSASEAIRPSFGLISPAGTAICPLRRIKSTRPQSIAAELEEGCQFDFLLLSVWLFEPPV